LTAPLMSLLQRRSANYDLLMREIRKVPYLADYLKKIVARVGYPNYHPDKLPDKYKKQPAVNVLYPVGPGIYIHVYMPPEGTVSGYRKYVVVEPPRPPNILFELVEQRMAELITEKDIVTDFEEKKKLLLRFLDKVVSIVDYPVRYERMISKILKSKKVPVYRNDYDRLKYYLIRDKIGLGILEPLIRDPYIEDISCDGVGFVYIVHKVFGPLETTIEFKTEEELDRFVIELSERIGKPVSHARPIVDATLPDGSRINIVFGKDVSLKGSNFTIRKFSKKPFSIIRLIKWGTFDEKVAAYLWILLLEGMSGFISGETASGKTTTLNAIIAFIRPTAKIITIEDTAEVQVPHDNWVRELTRDTGSVESSITMFDLLKAALRQRPNYIIVGEIRGAEGNVAFQAMQSVSWDTPILIKCKKDNAIKLMPIGKFVDRFYLGDGEKGPKLVKDYYILSMDPLGRIRWSEIQYVLRHKIREIYEVEYDDGGVVKVTGSHSVFVLDEETLEIKPKYVKDLHIGDLLVSYIGSGNLRKINGGNITIPLEQIDKIPERGIRSIPAWLWEAPSYIIKLFIESFKADVVKYDINRGILKLTLRKRDKAIALLWLARLAGLRSKLLKKNKGSCIRYEIQITINYDKFGQEKLIPTKPLITILLSMKPKDLPPFIREIVRKLREKRLVPYLRVSRLIEYLKKNASKLTDEAQKLLDKLELFIYSNILLLRVLNIRKVKYNGYVYDISVPETELFIGGEVPIALHNTGHPVLATFHAGSVLRLIQRITSPPINVPKTQLDNLNFVIIQSAVYREGVMLRRVLSVNEILGYDATSDSIIYIPVFTWDPTKDRFLFRGRGSSYLLEEKIATMRGIPRRKIKLIYDELELRAQILREMVKQNIEDYYEAFRIFAKIYGLIDEKMKGKGKEETQSTIIEGLKEALKRLKRRSL